MPLGDPTPVRAVRLSDGLMERVDGVREPLSRSEFVRRAVDEAVLFHEARLGRIAEIEVADAQERSVAARTVETGPTPEWA